MGDENMLGPENEDTSALFVSAQKKKRAEEEAKKRAEEEQAKREAAAAEVRRMEQEVEERRRKAEEEKQALENAEKNPEGSKSVGTSETAQSKKAAPAAPGAKNNMLFIGIGAAVAVLVIIFAIVGLTGKKGGAGNYADIGANGEYTPKASGFDIKFLYPGDVYQEVTEKKIDEDNLQIYFNPGKGKDVTTNIVMTSLKSEDSRDGQKRLLKSNIPLWGPSDISKMLTEGAKKQMETLMPGATIAEETTAAYSDDNPTTYTYDCTFTTDKYKSGVGRAWLEPNSAGEYKIVLLCCFKEKADNEGVASMRDLFLTNNAKEAFAMPGANPPASIDVEGLLENHEMHMGLHVPKDRFNKFEHTTNYDIWSDLNGAQIIVQSLESDVDEYGIENYDLDGVVASFKEISETGINSYNTAVESRMFLNDKSQTDGKITYTAEYRDVLAGVTYWERFYMTYWMDGTTGKTYWAKIITLAPEKNKDIYKNIFDKTLDTLEDI